MEQLHSALNSVKALRSSVHQVFDSLSNGLRADHGEEGKDTKFLLELQDLLTSVNHNLRDLEQSVGSLNPPPGPFVLGNSQFLSQESPQDRQALYPQLINTYKWTDRLHEYTTLGHALLNQNSLKRSYMTSSMSKRRRTVNSCHNVQPLMVDNLITSIDRNFPDMSLTISRPFTSNAMVQITLGRILKALVAFKGLMIEWVIVKGYNETLDLWTESRHKVFQKVTENANAAMLHFSSPTLPDLAVRSFMTWLHSYITLFSDRCKRCGNHLRGAAPPTWRDFRSLDPYHVECKP